MARDVGSSSYRRYNRHNIDGLQFNTLEKVELQISKRSEKRVILTVSKGVSITYAEFVLM
jgi:hypothetical protein